MVDEGQRKCRFLVVFAAQAWLRTTRNDREEGESFWDGGSGMVDEGQKKCRFLVVFAAQAQLGTTRNDREEGDRVGMVVPGWWDG